jgi:hypothetical protein
VSIVFADGKRYNLQLRLGNPGFLIIKDAVDKKMAEVVGHQLPIFAEGGFEGKSSTILLFCSFVVSNIPTPL